MWERYCDPQPYLEKVWVKVLESDLASLRLYLASLRNKLKLKV
ncbi:MAG: hypothetical protein PHS94_07475 [Erysipelotrichaceae bacterium]|nr:hypothetical protein [Erysipelotrichaceae bacterium]